MARGARPSQRVSLQAQAAGPRGDAAFRRWGSGGRSQRHRGKNPVYFTYPPALPHLRLAPGAPRPGSVRPPRLAVVMGRIYAGYLSHPGSQDHAATSLPRSLPVLQPERSFAGGEGSVSPLGLTMPLLLDILPQHTERGSSTAQDAIGPTPEHRLPIPPSQFRSIISSQQP